MQCHMPVGKFFSVCRIGRYTEPCMNSTGTCNPHMLNLALNITGLTNDDLFYYKNKVRIDNVALGYQERAIALAAPA